MTEQTTSQTPFIKKLAQILEKNEFNDIIRFSEDRKIIEIIDQAQLEEQILPTYFKHRKYDSFIRQLNLYGFKKLRTGENTRFRHRDLENGLKLQNIQTQRRIKRSSQNEEINDCSEQQAIMNTIQKTENQNPLDNRSNQTKKEQATVTEVRKDGSQNTIAPNQMPSFVNSPFFYPPQFYGPQGPIFNPYYCMPPNFF